MNKLVLAYNRFKIYITNSIWIFIGLVVRTIIVIFIVSKIAKMLGITDFGWYNFGISIFTILFSISTLGFGDSFIIKFFVNKEFSIEEIIGTTFIARIVGSLILLLLLSLWIFAFTDDHHYWVLLIASASILFQSSEVLSIYFQFKLKAKVYIPVSLLSLTAVALLLIYGIIHNYGLFYFITVYTLERVFIFFGLLWAINKEVLIRNFKFRGILFKTLIIQSWPLLLGTILTAMYARFDQILIKYFLSTSDLGIYGTGVILCQIWFVIPSLIIPVLLPKIAELSVNPDRENFNKTAFILYGILNYLALAVIVFIFIFGKFIIINLYGPEYSESVFILKILILNLIILFQSHLTSNIMVFENEEKYLFKIKLISVISNITLNVILLSSLGIRFAAFSLIISSMISWFVMALFNKKMLELMKLNFKSYLLPFYLNKILK